jgi:hypothetical protein
MEIQEMIKHAQDNDEAIVDKIKESLENNLVLKEIIKKVNNFDYDYLSSNDISGVDCRVSFDLKDLGLSELDEDYVKEALENYLEDESCLYLNWNDKEIYTSTSDEIWLNTHDKNIFFPEGNNKNDKYVDDFHAWLLAEEYMESKGYFPGIYTQDYWGNVDEFKESFKEFFPDESKAKIKKLDDYLDLYKTKSALDEGYRYNINDLPESIFDCFSKEIKDINFNNPVEVISIDEIEAGKVTLTISMSVDEDNISEQQVTILLTPNSIDFITRVASN